MTALQTKLKELPTCPGIYYHLDAQDQIIYIGKASNLRQRVRSYFQETNSRKNYQLQGQIADIKWRVTENALQALFLESEMIKRYQPKYNVLEKNVLGDSWVYVKLSFESSHPHLLLVQDIDEAESSTYLGPYLDAQALKRVLKYLRLSFPFSMHKTLPTRTCLDYHLGLCSGPETKNFNSKEACLNLRHLKPVSWVVRNF